MRPFGKLMERDEALRRLLCAVAPVRGIEAVALERAAGRVLARPVRAPSDVPGFARSAMDGYAVRAADTASAPVALALLPTPAAARRTGPTRRPLSPGECRAIATGAEIPPGADAVVPVERTRPAREEGAVAVLDPARAGDHVRARGHDVRKGATVLKAGDVATPARIGLAAALGLRRIPVWRLPKVVVAATGDELVPAGKRLRPGEIHDSNSPALAAALASWGAQVRRLPPVRDTPAALALALSRSRGADLVVFTGGSSVGEKDLLVDGLRASGRVLVHGIRVRPGKPLLVGKLADGRVVVGLPGNPASAITNAALFLAPALRRIGRRPQGPERIARVPLAEDASAVPDRYTVLPVEIRDGEARSTFKDSGAVTSVADSDGWIGIEAGETRKAGEIVEVRLW